MDPSDNLTYLMTNYVCDWAINRSEDKQNGHHKIKCTTQITNKWTKDIKHHKAWNWSFYSCLHLFRNTKLVHIYNWNKLLNVWTLGLHTVLIICMVLYCLYFNLKNASILLLHDQKFVFLMEVVSPHLDC